MIADASVWVSVLNRPDPHHSASRRWFHDFTDAGEAVLAPMLLLAEVGGAIARRRQSAGLGRDAIDRLLAVPTLQLIEIDRRLGTLSAEVAADLRLRGSDAVYVALAYDLDLPLVSWDAEQIERGGRLVAARTP